MANLPREVQEALQSNCVKARKARRPYRFFYCPAGEDDAPVLLIERRLSPKAIRTIRRGARQKKYLTGEVLSEEGILVLVPIEAGPSGRLKKHLKQWYGPAIPLLRRAIVRDGEGQEPDLDRWEGGDVDAAEARLKQVRVEVAEAEAAEKDALKQVEELARQVAEAKELWEDLGMDADNAEKQYKKRVKETTTVLGRVRGFLSGRRSDKAREDAEREALWRADQAQEEAFRGKRVYERLLASLSQAQASLNAGQETLHRLDAEGMLVNAEASRVHAALVDARGEGAERTRDLNDAEDALEEALSADPVLGQLLEDARGMEADADRMTEESVAIQLELEALEDRRADLLATLSETPGNEPLTRLAELEADIQRKGQRLHTLIDVIDDADAAAVLAREALEEAITVSQNPAITRARKKRQQARTDLARIDAAEGALEIGLERTSEAAEEAVRKRRVEEVAIQARNAIASYADFYVDVRKIDPRNEAHIERHPEVLRQPTTINALADANHYYDQLVEVGATAAEIKAIFAPVPPAWRPAALAEHLQWFEKLDAWEQKMAENEASESLLVEIERDLSGSKRMEALDADAEVLRNEIERESKLLGSAQGGGLLSVLPPDAVDKMILVIQLVNAGMDARNFARDLSGREASQKVFDRESGDYVAIDPVTQKMRDEQLMATIASLGPLGLNVLGAITDALGQSLTGPTQVVKAEALYRQIKEAATRVGRAMQDSVLLEEARSDNHVASEALEQSRDQERRKAARAAVSASLKTLDLGADFALIAGQGAAAAAVCKIAAVSGDFTNRAAHSANDFRIASKARRLFQQARDENLSAEKRAAAARKLFKFSQKHAKGILAWLAKEGDPIAMKYSRARGLTDEEIRRTSPAVLQRFLLQRAGEGTGEQETFEEWLEGVIAYWRERLARIGKLIHTGTQKLEGWMDAVSNGRLDARLQIRPVPAVAISALAEALAKLADRRRFLVSRPTSPRITTCLGKLDTARGLFDREATDKRVIIAANLRTLSGYRDEIRRRIPDAEPEIAPVWQGAESRIEKLTRTNLQSMQMLASLR